MSDRMCRLCEAVDREDRGAWWSLRKILTLLNDKGADIRHPRGEKYWDANTLCETLKMHFQAHPEDEDYIVLATHPQVVDKTEAYGRDAIGTFYDASADEYHWRQQSAYTDGRDDLDDDPYPPMPMPHAFTKRRS